MTDRLKEYIDSNLNAFNELEPPKDSWDQIASRMGHRQNRPLQIFKYTGMIAAATILAFVVFYSPIFDSASNSVNMADLPEIVETEAYYNLQVNQKRNQIYQLAGQHPALKQEMDNDLAELDSLLIEIKNDLKDNVSNAEVVDAMIQNYRMKLMILEDIMMFLESQNTDHEKTETYEL